MLDPLSCGFDVRSPGEMEADDERMAVLEAARAPRMPVSTRVRRVVQPAGGWLPVRLFDRVPLGDPVRLHGFENIPPDVMGLAVDYMSRVAAGVPVRDVFRVPLAGAALAGRADDAERLLARVDGFSDSSLSAACLLCGFDSASRAGTARWQDGRVPSPDRETLWNLRRMVARTMRFLEEYGPVVWEGFTFDGGYTDLVTSGSGDVLAGDGLWDLKTSRHAPAATWTLQLLVYWRLGMHSSRPEYARVRRLGVYNPRLDTLWRIPVSRIPADAVREVEARVIGYDTP